MRRFAFSFALSLLALPFSASFASAEEAPRPPQPPPAGDVSLPLAPVLDDELLCERAFIERVYRETKPSVVRITRPDGGLGTGFVFFSPKHVATAFHVVDLGRDVRVEFPGGKTTTAEVVAVDEAHDLAILELAEPSEAKPLKPRTEVPVGAALLAIGNPYGDLTRSTAELEGLLNFSISQGIVSAKSDSYLQTDAALSPGNSGGPMLTCDGKVVAVADKLLDSRIGFGVPVAHLTALTTHIGERRFFGRFTGRDGAIGIAWNRDTSSYFGPYLGGSIVGGDRFAITVRLGVLFAGKQDTTDPVVDRTVRRFFGELTLGWRFLLFPYALPTYLTVSAGGVATIDRGEQTRLVLDAASPTQLTSFTTSIRGGGIAPIGQATLNFGNLETSYGFALDVAHPDLSTHRVLVGVSY